jgi:hypothetical protein
LSPTAGRRARRALAAPAYGPTHAPGWLVAAAACACLALCAPACAESPLALAPKGSRAANVTAQCRWDGAPLWWLHAPKTASTFCNILVRAVCPGIQLAEQLREPNTELLVRHGCPAHGKMANVRPGHRSLPSSFKGAKVAIVSLFREPVARVASGYFHNLHDCRRMQRKYGLNEWDDVGLFTNATLRRTVYGERGVNLPVLLEYAACVGACHTRMLLHTGCGDDRGPLGRGVRNITHALALAELSPAGQAMVRRAVKLVSETLAFVGVTELFRESVQAFGAFAAVPVVPRLDFGNTRPSWADRGQKAVAEAALAHMPLVDTFVYRAASERLAAFTSRCQT